MVLQQQPIAGHWYANAAGQLIYVRAVLFVKGRVSRIAFEHTNGRRVYVNGAGWGRLCMVLHRQRSLGRGSARGS